MSVKIRLTRMGTNKRPYYRIVAVDSRKKRDGAYLEELGYYHPLHEENPVRVNEERIRYWLEKGAQPTHTVKTILKKQGIRLE